MKKIEPKDARYIKLGEGGKYESVCFRENILRLGYYEFPNFGNMSDGEIREKALEFALTQYRDKGAAKNHARQVADFHCCGEDTLWFTFADGRLHWCFAAPDVKIIGRDKNKCPLGNRERRVAGRWRSTDINGDALISEELPGNLVKTGAYRGTICEISRQAKRRLTDIINGVKSDELKETEKHGAAFLESVVNLISCLHDKDFELLVDLVFSRSGWRRIGAIGGAQKDVDIGLELPITNEKAFVQVKSKTTRAVFEDYINRFRKRPETKMFYVFHSTRDLKLTVPDEDRNNIIIIDAERLAKNAISTGLVDWVMNKSR